MTLRMKSVLDVGTSLGPRMDERSSDLTPRLWREPSELARRMPLVSPIARFMSRSCPPKSNAGLGGMLGEKPPKPPKEDDEEDATWVLRSSETAGEPPSAEANQMGGRDDVSDLLRERFKNIWEERRDVSERLMLLAWEEKEGS